MDPNHIVFTTDDYADSDDEDFADVEDFAYENNTSTGQILQSEGFGPMGSVNHGFEPEPIAVDNDGGVIPANDSGPGITQTGPRAPEYVALHRTPAVLQINEYLTEEQKKLWHDFFNVTPINSEELFMKYSAYYSARRFLWNRGWVTITGFPGDGKRALAEHLMVKFVRKPEKPPQRPTPKEQNEWEGAWLDEDGRPQYTVVHVNSYQEWQRKVDPTKKQCVLIDKIFGPATYTISKVEEWINHLDEILETAVRNRPNTLVIITFQKHQLEKIHPRVTLCPLFQSKHVIDLTNDRYKAKNNERQKILEGSCSGKHGLLINEQDDVIRSNLNSFAYHCRLYGGVKSFHMEGMQYFKSPENSMETVLEKVFRFDKIIYYTLACVGLFDGKIELDKGRFEDYTAFQQNIFRQLKIALEVPHDVNLEKMRHACTLLCGVFLEPIQLHHWKFCHERMFFFVTHSVFKRIPLKVLEICSLNFLMERIRTSSYFTITMESNLCVWNKDYTALAQRLVFEILRSNARLIASHPSLCDIRFGEAFVKFMGEMGSLQPVFLQRADYHRSFFFWLCYYGQEQTIKHLLKHEDFKNIKEMEWFKEELDVSLFAACNRNGASSGRVVKMLLEEGASLSSRDPLPDDDFVLLYGQDMFELTRKLNAPLLHVAALYGSLDTLQGLIANGADVNQRTEDGFSVYHRVARNPDDAALRALLQPKPDLTSIKSATGSLPIHEAIRCGNDNATRHFSEGIPKDAYKMEDGRSMLAAATGVGVESVVKTLSNAMGSANPVGCQDNWPPLHSACAFGNANLVETLLGNGADVNAKGTGGWTALHFAVLFNRSRIVEFLLKKKADVNSQAMDRKTPLHIAAENDHWSLVDLLLENGAKPENTTNEGDFAITLAASNGHIELVKTFVEEGIELEFPQVREEDPDERQRAFMMMMGRGREQDRLERMMRYTMREKAKNMKK
uniref:Novel STAND NTPase 3 domain-containing protein n=3 Tax=Magallana gigas TaxID=29159 RepID=A0A8W8KW49_MAGGI|nr:uncharacterized protein LOC105321881 [Crassostrea gigas]